MQRWPTLQCSLIAPRRTRRNWLLSPLTNTTGRLMATISEICHGGFVNAAVCKAPVTTMHQSTIRSVASWHCDHACRNRTLSDRQHMHGSLQSRASSATCVRDWCVSSVLKSRHVEHRIEYAIQLQHARKCHSSTEDVLRDEQSSVAPVFSALPRSCHS